MEPRRSIPTPLLLPLCLPLLLTGCEEVEQIVDSRRDPTPHESYVQSLVDAGLVETALGREWTAAARQAVSRPNPVTLPFEEEGYLPPEDPAAVGYRISLERGRVLGVRLELESGDSLRVFFDLFRVPESPDDPLRPVLTSETLPGTVSYEPDRTGEFILRVQPELLRGGRYRLVLTQDPALAFPVEDVDERAVWSVFGDGRDGGRRLHHGVDIFAARGTPALAAADGEVYRVQETSRGGRVVWIRDDARGARLYYAHLDSQLVSEGTRVETGDTVGLVGNTGNARTTAPHLHFGIYSRGGGERGPIDPMPFIRPSRARPTRLAGDPGLVGGWVRVRESASVHVGPDQDASVTAELEGPAPLRVLAGAGSWYRVSLPAGGEGWIPVRATEPATSPLHDWVATEEALVLAGPSEGAPAVAGVEPGTTLAVLGSWEGFSWVETPAGRRGWVSGVSGED